MRPRRVLRQGGRTFLENERFDRHGPWGRSPLVSLASLDGALIGASRQDWPGLAQRLLGLKLLTATQMQDVAIQWWFGRLIGNTDMHTGNLSFRPRGGLLDAAPAYDMLPMAYAPLRGGEVPQRLFEPPLPLPAEQATWFQAWTRVQADARVSASFKPVAAAHAARLAHAGQMLGGRVPFQGGDKPS